MVGSNQFGIISGDVADHVMVMNNYSRKNGLVFFFIFKTNMDIYYVIYKCCHPNLLQHGQKLWLKPCSEAFVVLKNILLHKSLLCNLNHFTNFSYTGSLHIYYSSYNKWLPKSTHFSYQRMIAHSLLAAIDFNLCSELSQAETKSKEKRFNVTYSKANYNWLAKPIKKKKNGSVFKNLVSRVVANGKHLPKPMLPILPNTIASVQKPFKSMVISNQRSPFR